MPDDPVDILQRWELAGGVWRIIGRGHELTIGLFQCDGGERVDVIRSGDAALHAFVGDRESNAD
ncbi:hypothetical protein [Mycolicibacterium phocaicum]|uniref:Uncharacterized protein n=1 Tax=Mycolicibacterium phocaicum TaxID=319706 RepID=A0A7I7ZH49_9MYCO|nr:hypothetical protein [Mycolicibacterium phocaicum]TLH65607.1 hypothetical protein C1S79_17225 [Mycolicibacterium phocaicum]BBZ53159.1 hypothetical protein MPHO_01510 [Mycolicibacterium phocaicum]